MNALTKMVVSMLNDDHGVSEKTYKHLRELIHELNDNSAIRADLDAVMRQVDATDGRFYLPIR